MKSMKTFLLFVGGILAILSGLTALVAIWTTGQDVQMRMFDTAVLLVAGSFLSGFVALVLDG